MLNSYRKGAIAVAAALSFVAGAAQAKDHVVLIVDGSYFPSVVYVSHGDNILFLNNSDAMHEVYGPEDTWTSGNIASEATFVLNLEEGTPPTFAGVGPDGVETQGEIVFSGAPITD